MIALLLNSGRSNDIIFDGAMLLAGVHDGPPSFARSLSTESGCSPFLFQEASPFPFRWCTGTTSGQSNANGVWILVQLNCLFVQWHSTKS